MKNAKKLHLLLYVGLIAIIVLFIAVASTVIVGLGKTYKNIKIEQEKLKLTESKITQLRELAKNLNDLSDKAKLIGKSLPNSKDVSLLISQIEQLFCPENVSADKCIIKSINFGNQSNIPEDLKATAINSDPALSQSYKKGDLALLPITINLTTTYLDLYDKLRALEQFSRFIFISNAAIQGNTNQMLVTLDMFTYYQPDKLPSSETAPNTQVEE